MLASLASYATAAAKSARIAGYRKGDFAYLNAARLDIIPGCQVYGSMVNFSESLTLFAVESTNFGANAVQVATEQFSIPIARATCLPS